MDKNAICKQVNSIGLVYDRLEKFNELADALEAKVVELSARLSCVLRRPLPSETNNEKRCPDEVKLAEDICVLYDKVRNSADYIKDLIERLEI